MLIEDHINFPGATGSDPTKRDKHRGVWSQVYQHDPGV